MNMTPLNLLNCGHCDLTSDALSYNITIRPYTLIYSAAPGFVILFIWDTNLAYLVAIIPGPVY